MSVATDIPTNAGFENGYSEDIIDVVENIKRLAETGIAGFSIEDFSHEHRQLYDFSEAIERVQVAVETVAELGVPLVLGARAENSLRGLMA